MSEKNKSDGCVNCSKKRNKALVSFGTVGMVLFIIADSMFFGIVTDEQHEIILTGIFYVVLMGVFGFVGFCGHRLLGEYCNTKKNRSNWFLAGSVITFLFLMLSVLVLANIWYIQMDIVDPENINVLVGFAILFALSLSPTIFAVGDYPHQMPAREFFQYLLK